LRVNFPQRHVCFPKTIRVCCAKPREAAGSTSPGAFSSMPMRGLALTKPTVEATPFVSFDLLFQVESQQKPKQTGPKHRQSTSFASNRDRLRISPFLDLAVQIRFLLLQNRQGKTRLAKYYVPLEDSEKHKVEFEVRGVRRSRLVRPDCSFGFLTLFSFLVYRCTGWWSIGIPSSRTSLRYATSSVGFHPEVLSAAQFFLRRKMTS
jgi:hypothetical protein